VNTAISPAACGQQWHKFLREISLVGLVGGTTEPGSVRLCCASDVSTKSRERRLSFMRWPRDPTEIERSTVQTASSFAGNSVNGKVEWRFGIKRNMMRRANLLA
jgi:hypothetical protein